VSLLLILVTALSVIGVAGYVRLKQSSLTAKTRVTYLFVGAAVIGYGIWAAMVLTLAATGLGAKSDFLGSQLFIVTSQIIFIVIGAFIGEYLSTNSAFQSFAGKIKQRL
jgi:general stress protein CsbA